MALRCRKVNYGSAMGKESQEKRTKMNSPDCLSFSRCREICSEFSGVLFWGWPCAGSHSRPAVQLPIAHLTWHAEQVWNCPGFHPLARSWNLHCSLELFVQVWHQVCWWCARAQLCTTQWPGETRARHAPFLGLLESWDNHMVMELGGHTVATAATVEQLREVACGLAYLHSRGVAHLDIKPSNLVYGKGRQLWTVQMECQPQSCQSLLLLACASRIRPGTGVRSVGLNKLKIGDRLRDWRQLRAAPASASRQDQG